MPRKNAGGSGILDKRDEAPELTEAFFTAATVHDGNKVVRRGRPKLAAPKRLVSIRFPVATLERLRAVGPGWQALVVKAVEAALDRSEVEAAEVARTEPRTGPGTVTARTRRCERV